MSRNQCIDQDRFDERSYDGMLRKSGELTNLAFKGAERLMSYPHLQRDIFASLYKFSPKLKGEVPADIRYNHQLIERMMQDRRWEELRTNTKLDEFNAALGTLSIAHGLLESLPDGALEPEQYEDIQKINELSSLSALAEQAREKAEAYDEIVASEHYPNLPKHEQLRIEQERETHHYQLRQYQEKIEDKKIEVEKVLEGKGNEMRQMFRPILQEALEQVDKAEEYLEAWGTKPGEMQKLGWEDRIKLAKVIMETDKLQKIAEMAGRMKRLAISKQKTKFAQARDEVYSVESGDDLSRIVPGEMILLSDPALEDIFYKKMAEKSLLCYALKGQEKLGKGPIICLIDESLSMRGDKETWAKAVAIGLLQISQMQKRKCVAVRFASKGQVEAKEINGYQDLLDMASHFFGGGTDYETPLSQAEDSIKRQNMKDADIIIVSDGECSVSDDFLDELKVFKKQTETSIFGVLIDVDIHYSEYLSKFCDQIFYCSDIIEDGRRIAGEIFGNV